MVRPSMGTPARRNGLGRRAAMPGWLWPPHPLLLLLRCTCAGAAAERRQTTEQQRCTRQGWSGCRAPPRRPPLEPSSRAGAPLRAWDACIDVEQSGRQAERGPGSQGGAAPTDLASRVGVGVLQRGGLNPWLP